MVTRWYVFLSNNKTFPLTFTGNYLISGGDETVLVIWQLSTGKQQHLPHLTAAIENIVVSPIGSSYAVTLANNSVVVLSTTELEAKANIIGIQSRRIDLEQLPRENNNDYFFDIFSQVAMAVDPKNPNQLLFSTPSSQARRGAGLLPEPYLQTFDISTERPTARQALTRNNATDPNMAPDGRRILEPDGILLEISHDGQWLATIDEWIPPRSDMGYLNEGIVEFNEEERKFRREIYLKIWRWDKNKIQWTLETRIDAPHSFEAVGACARVLDLVVDPTEAGFVTVGEDGFVRVWRPKTRLRDGTVVRGGDKNRGEGLVTWSLHRSIELSTSLDVLDPPTEYTPLVPQTSRLAFSPDGSVLAAGVSWASEADPGVIHLIDTAAGTIRRSITEVDVSMLSCLGILGRHMIVISDSIVVWDLVMDELVYSFPFHCSGIDPFERTPLIRLAVNQANETFAVSLPQFESNDSAKSRSMRNTLKASSKISIFDPYRPQPLWSSSTPDILLSLVSAGDSRGYISLDSSSRIRTISPKASALLLITPPPESESQIEVSNAEIESDSEDSKPGKLIETFGDFEDLQTENDKPVVRPEQLQEIFDIGSFHTLPPVKDLFSAVVGLYARKPRVSDTV
jgi:NET1-associated nuclear protein 1 (U3 small nucleolar RNA-associated protein 17)